MKGAVELLKQFGVDVEAKIISAHRTREFLYEYAKSVSNSGVEVIIAGAGGAAHLPGMLAALTQLPVIGVPITSKLLGFDSLLSIVQMPTGVPVAAVGIGNAKNAAFYALRILGIKYPEIAFKLKQYIEEMKKEVLTLKLGEV